MSLRTFLLKSLVLVVIFGLSGPVIAQCINPFSFGSATVSEIEGNTVTATTCAFVSEFSTFNGLVQGGTYEFEHVSTSPTNYITLTDMANNILLHGPSPLTYTATFSGSVRLHYSNDAICTATPGGCREGRATTVSLNAYSVGGTVAGLQGSGLVLQNNGADDLAISANGSFAFSALLPAGSAYEVTVLTQPQSPSQICSVNNGAGMISDEDVTTVTVDCVTEELRPPMPVPLMSPAGLALLALLLILLAGFGIRRLA